MSVKGEQSQVKVLGKLSYSGPVQVTHIDLQAGFLQVNIDRRQFPKVDQRDPFCLLSENKVLYMSYKYTD